MEEIRKRGSLRILTPWMLESYLPRDGYPPDFERELAAKFARSLGVSATLVSVGKFEDLIPSLQAGKGDIIAANLTVLESRKKQITFSLPVGRSREQVMTRAALRAIWDSIPISGLTMLRRQCFCSQSRNTPNRPATVMCAGQSR